MNLSYERLVFFNPGDRDGWNGSGPKETLDDIAKRLREVEEVVIEPAQEVNKEVDEVLGE